MEPDIPAPTELFEGPPSASNNSENDSDSELFEPTQVAPEADGDEFEKIGKVGRQRKYDQFGNHGENPVRDVVLYRYKTGEHWPGLSDDMQAWYEFYYFTKPSKAKDGDKYEQHKRAWDRRSNWITEEATALGISRKIIAYRRRPS